MFATALPGLYIYCGVVSWLAWRRFAPLLTPMGTLVGATGWAELMPSIVLEQAALVRRRILELSGEPAQ